MRLFHGVMGARSMLSVGRGTVAEYAHQAHAQGLDFLIMLEDFSALTPAKFTELKAQCQAASNEHLLVLPGFTIQDVFGDRYFACGPRLDWPAAGLLTPDNTRLTDRQESEDAWQRHSASSGRSSASASINWRIIPSPMMIFAFMTHWGW